MFEPVDPNEIPNFHRGKKGRIAYPIVKAFMEEGHVCVKVDRAKFDKSPQQLYASLSHHVKQHRMPIKVFTREGEVYMARTDLNPDGTANEYYQSNNNHDDDDNVEVITPEEVRTQGSDLSE